MELVGNLLSTPLGTFHVIHHMNRDTTQHSVVAFDEEHADMAREALCNGRNLEEFYTFTPLKELYEFQPYFHGFGIFKKGKPQQVIGLWDVPLIAFQEGKLTRENFQNSPYTQVCEKAVREGKVLTHRISKNKLNHQDPKEFEDEIDWSNAPSMVLDKPLEGDPLEEITEITLAEDEMENAPKSETKKGAKQESDFLVKGGDGILDLETEKDAQVEELEF